MGVQQSRTGVCSLENNKDTYVALLVPADGSTAVQHKSKHHARWMTCQYSARVIRLFEPSDGPSEFAHQNERKRDCDASTADSVPTPLIRRRSETMRDGKRGQVIYANAKSTCPQIILNEDARVVCGIFVMEL